MRILPQIVHLRFGRRLEGRAQPLHRVPKTREGDGPDGRLDEPHPGRGLPAAPRQDADGHPAQARGRGRGLKPRRPDLVHRVPHPPLQGHDPQGVLRATRKGARGGPEHRRRRRRGRGRQARGGALHDARGVVSATRSGARGVCRGQKEARGENQRADRKGGQGRRQGHGGEARAPDPRERRHDGDEPHRTDARGREAQGVEKIRRGRAPGGARQGGEGRQGRGRREKSQNEGADGHVRRRRARRAEEVTTVRRKDCAF
mmetsp:Transcript_6531/g.19216  ORF Transcript_6531/g.19216 Transcript_6531/m.19216 type:complete len:259 (-) Transcript_6531:16-792(-)